MGSEVQFWAQRKRRGQVQRDLRAVKGKVGVNKTREKTKGEKKNRAKKKSDIGPRTGDRFRGYGGGK